MTEYAYSCPISVRSDDLDGNDHVNNVVYARYLQTARGTYSRSLRNGSTDFSSVVANLNIDFHSPIVLEDDVYVDVRIATVGTSSWTYEYRVRAIDPDGDERVAATGSNVQVAWDRDRERSREIPDGWREALEKERIDVDA